MTPQQWARAAARIPQLWPHAKVDPAALLSWLPLLDDLDPDAVTAAVERLACDPDRRFPPESAGVIRAAVLDDDDDVDLSDLAYAIRRVGHYQPRPALPPVLDAYVDAHGGWKQVCLTFDPSSTTTQAQWRDFRAAHRRRRTTSRARAALATSRAAELERAVP